MVGLESRLNRSLLKEIGGKHGISLRVWVLATPLVLFGTFFSLGVNGVVSYPLAMITLAIISHLLIGLLIYITTKTFFKPERFFKPRPFLVLSIHAVFGSIRGVLVWAFESGLLGVLQPDLWIRVIAQIGQYTFWASLATLLYTSWDNYRSAVSELDARVRAQQNVLERGQLELTELREQVLTQVDEILGRGLVGNPTHSELQSLADQISSPQARISFEERLRAALEVKVGGAKIRYRQVLASALLQPSGSLWPIIFGAAAPGLVMILNVGFLGALQTTATLLLILFTLYLNNFLKFKRPLLIVPVYLSSIGMSVALGIAVHDRFTELDVSFTSLTLGMWLGALMSIFYLSFRDHNEATLKSLSLATDALEAAASRIMQELWVEERHLARLVHSEVQGRLRAAAILANSTGDKADLEVLRNECLEILRLPKQVESLEEFESETNSVWGQILDLRFELSESPRSLLRGDDYLRETFFHVVREAVLNAVKHSEASRCWIKAEVASSKQLVLEVRNDGKPKSGKIAGQGSSLFDETCVSWSLRSSSEGALLSAVLATNESQVGFFAFSGSHAT